VAVEVLGEKSAPDVSGGRRGQKVFWATTNQSPAEGEKREKKKQEGGGKREIWKKKKDRCDTTGKGKPQ